VDVEFSLLVMCGLIAIQMGRPSKICGSDPASSGGMISPHQLPQRVVQSPSPTVVPGAGGYLGAATLPHATGSAWQSSDDRLTGLHHDWTLDHVIGQAHRRSSDTWSGQYSDSGTGGLLTDDAGSLEPSPKRRHSDSYASSSSPYQFSPPQSGSGSCVELPQTGTRSGSSDGSQRSRQSSMSSQEAAAYHGGGLWGTSPTTTTNLAVRVGPPTTTYGVLRMSGGEMLQRAPGPGSGSSAVSEQDVYMHWNLPLPTATTTTTSMKLEETGGRDLGAFQAREMSDVIENIIRQQQLPATTDSLATEYGGLQSVMDTHDAALSLRHHQQQQPRHQSAVVTTGIVDSLQSFLGQTAATTRSTQGFISSFSPITVAARPADDDSVTVDASDWINHLSEDLTDDKSSPARHADILTSCLSDEGPDADIEAQVQEAMSYWLHPNLPDENVMLADRHWDVLNRVVPAYNRFVQFGTNVNRKLKIKFDVSHVISYKNSLTIIIVFRYSCVTKLAVSFPTNVVLVFTAQLNFDPYYTVDNNSFVVTCLT